VRDAGVMRGLREGALRMARQTRKHIP
jgi:hypothetical protein